MADARDDAASAPLHSVFSEDELRHIQLVALSPDTLGSRISAHLAYLATPALFGLYGIVSGSPKVLGIAFVVILLLIGWGIVSEARGYRHVELSRSVMAKLADRIAREREG